MTKQEIENFRAGVRAAATILTTEIHDLIADRNQLLKCARALAGQCHGVGAAPDRTVVAENQLGEDNKHHVITLGDCRRARDMLRRMGEE